MSTGIVSAARRYIGAPFSWFGKCPQGFDCIGLVFKAAEDCGEHHEPFAQRFGLDLYAELGRRLIEIPFEKATRGDVLLMTMGRDNPPHMALITDTRPFTILHATVEGGVIEQPLETPALKGLPVTYADLAFAAFRFHIAKR